MRSEKATAGWTYLRCKGKQLKDLKNGSCNVLSLYQPRAPKLRWGDGVDQDIRLLRARNWKNLALNREEWRKLLKKARAHTRLSSQ
jgi:hypothetical protein